MHHPSKVSPEPNERCHVIVSSTTVSSCHTTKMLHVERGRVHEVLQNGRVFVHSSMSVPNNLKTDINVLQTETDSKLNMERQTSTTTSITTHPTNNDKLFLHLELRNRDISPK